MIDLIKGDCLEAMKTIESGSVDAIITDPPYGTTACKWDSIIPFDKMWERLNKLIKPNGAIVLFGSEPFSSALRMSNIKNYKYDWKWDKVKPTAHGIAKYQPLRRYEDIIIFNGKTYNPQMVEKDKPRVAYGSNTTKANEHKFGYKKMEKYEITHSYPQNILKISNANQKGRVHPTQKPVALMEYLIKTYTNESETVLDFTMGSGSTGVACVNTNRSFIGIEMDENYFNIATERINKE
tara:strand:- start:416 stop:1129 length:714 start_codon:yes stop_codon:yes gene_type:complete